MMVSAGLWLILFGIFIGSLGVPTSSEILLPVAGAMIRHGEVSPFLVFGLCWLAQVIGASLAYWIGRTGGVAIIRNYGKYVLFSEHKLKLAQRQFRSRGSWIVLVGRCLPILVSYISFPAGIARMGFGRFLAMTAIGSAVWVVGLLYLGYVLAANLDGLTRGLHNFSLVIAVVIAGAAIWYVRHLRSLKH